MKAGETWLCDGVVYRVVKAEGRTVTFTRDVTLAQVDDGEEPGVVGADVFDVEFREMTAEQGWMRV